MTTDRKPDVQLACCQCGESIWMTFAVHQTYQRNNNVFYCVHGHEQHFALGKTEAEKLRGQLDAERQARQRAEQQVARWQDYEREARADADHQRARANGYKGFAAKITKRAKAGVCPCCNRHFAQLARHMASKHPQFTQLDLDGAADQTTAPATLQ